ncbi:MAG: helix-turn-helix domain-containing protein [Candidatus Saccharimonadales bacterium]
MKRSPRIAAVAPGVRPLCVLVSWKNGGDPDRIDLAELIRGLKGLAPLRDPALFRKVRVKNWAWAIEWPRRGGGLDIGAETLRRLAREQKGELMPAAQFARWRARHKLSLEAAAKALGLGRRTVVLYEQGQKPIPKTVLLATIGFDAKSGRRRAA